MRAEGLRRAAGPAAAHHRRRAGFLPRLPAGGRDPNREVPAQVLRRALSDCRNDSLKSAVFV
jgi:hypothetical protein